MKGVVLLPKPDRVPLARSTNTNEFAPYTGVGGRVNRWVAMLGIKGKRGAMTDTPAPRFIHFLGAFAAGGLITLMLLTNGTLAQYGTLLFSSFVPHLTGTVLAIVILLILRPARATPQRPPLWAYLGGVSGGLTVIASSAAMNSALALSGTIALGLAGQIMFSLVADARGLFGLPQRMPTLRDLAGLSLIIAGALVIIFFGGTP